jgi:hypothetical protein
VVSEERETSGWRLGVVFVTEHDRLFVPRDSLRRLRRPTLAALLTAATAWVEELDPALLGDARLAARYEGEGLYPNGLEVSWSTEPEDPTCEIRLRGDQLPNGERWPVEQGRLDPDRLAEHPEELLEQLERPDTEALGAFYPTWVERRFQAPPRFTEVTYREATPRDLGVRNRIDPPGASEWRAYLITSSGDEGYRFFRLEGDTITMPWSQLVEKAAGELALHAGSGDPRLMLVNHGDDRYLHRGTSLILNPRGATVALDEARQVAPRNSAAEYLAVSVIAPGAPTALADSAGFTETEGAQLLALLAHEASLPAWSEAGEVTVERYRMLVDTFGRHIAYEA